MTSSGGLVVVGSGIQLGRHVDERTLSEIRQAEVVFALVDSFAMHWLCSLRPDVRSLGIHYSDDRDRRESYRAMVSDVMDAVRSGQRVCAVFYGHPGVFAQVPHALVRAARAEDFDARMDPGISADACLYADLELDPGARGVQSFEATQLLIGDLNINPSVLLILWQVALTGNLDCVGFESDPARLALLVDKLSRWYPSDAEVILYEASQVPVFPFRADRCALAQLPQARFLEYTTLVIPPVTETTPDAEMLQRLADLPNRRR